jgi:hypothetical protein
MDFYTNKNRLNWAKWVTIFLTLDIISYLLLLVIFPNLWIIGYIVGLLIIGTIISYLIYEKLVKYNDNNWRKPAEMLETITIGLNAIFCIIIIAAIIIGVLNAAGV